MKNIEFGDIMETDNKKGRYMKYRVGEDQEEEIKRMAKECGFQNVSEFARVSMKFYYTMKDVVRSVIDFDSKLNVILEHTNNLSNTIESQNKLVVQTAEKVDKMYKDEELDRILKEIIRILQANYPKGYNIYELISLIGADQDSHKNDLFWHVVNNVDFFKCYVSVDNDFVTLREVPLWSGFERDSFGVKRV